MAAFASFPAAAALFSIAAVGLCGPAFAQPGPAAETVYSATFEPTAVTASGVVPRGKSLADVVVRPASAVILEASLDPVTAKSAAVTSGFDFTPGRVLFGTPDSPGLFCDVMRNRGLGSSAACLRDKNGDGAFDEAVRYDFNSGRSDRVFITDKGKVRGGKVKKTFPLRQTLAYRPAPDAPLPEARINLLWASTSPQKDDPAARRVVDLIVTDGSNFTGTEIMSGSYASVPIAEDAPELQFYGASIRLHGLTAEGDLRFSLNPGRTPQPMPLVFRGYRLIIVSY